MSKTFTQLVSAVQVNTNRSASSDTTNVQGWLNDALQEVARRHDWRDLAIEKETTLTEDTYRYALPTDTKTLRGIRLIDDTSSRWLTIKSKRWLNQYEPDPSSRSSGRPRWACIDGNYFELLPPPDDTYTIYINYYRWPAAMSDDADTPEIDQIDDVLTAYASWKAFMSIQLFDSAREWQREFERALLVARRMDDSEPEYDPVIDGVISVAPTAPGEYWNDPFAGLE